MSQVPKKSPVQANNEPTGSPGSLIVFDLRTLTRFQDERPYVQVLSDIGTARVVLLAFRAGQQLKDHITSSQILVQTLRGRVTFATAGNRVRLQAGMLVQLEENVLHSVVALTDAVVLLTLTPSPLQHSLENELFKDLTPLVARTASDE